MVKHISLPKDAVSEIRGVKAPRKYGKRLIGRVIGGTDENVLFIDFGSRKVLILDKDISLEELDGDSERLNKGKSTADGWVPGMVNNVNILASDYDFCRFLFLPTFLIPIR